jgi:hypothetical protein
MSTPVERIKNVVEVINPSKRRFNIEDTVNYIKGSYSRKSLVPIICEDMYEFTNPYTHEKQSLHSFIVERVIEKVTEEYQKKIQLTENEIQEIMYGGYYGLSLLREKVGSDICWKIIGAVLDDDDNIRNGIGLKDEVREFLKVCDFPLIITTSCFKILEKELGGEYESVWYNFNETNVSPFSGKCIYHLFGQATTDDVNWAYSEKRILEFLKSFFSPNSAPKNLTQKIKKNNGAKTLLVLGNDCPDWLFRFVLSPLYGEGYDIYDDKKRGYYVESSSNKTDERLEHFLNDIHFETLKQMIGVLKGVTDKIKSSRSMNTVVGHNKKYDFFISHASEDKEIADKIQKLLKDHGLEVWVDIDPTTNLDGQYWEKIIYGLKQSAYFMPVVTEAYIKKICDGTIWKEALKKMGKLSLDAEKAGELLGLDEKISGVMVELLLADSWRAENKLETYSIPVVVKNEHLLHELITIKRVNEWGKESIMLPKGLFYNLNMYSFDRNYEDGFNWEGNTHEFYYDNYKSAERRNNE